MNESIEKTDFSRTKERSARSPINNTGRGSKNFSQHLDDAWRMALVRGFTLAMREWLQKACVMLWRSIPSTPPKMALP